MENNSYRILTFVIFIALNICLVIGKTYIQIGVILDMETSVGKMSSTCISMAIHDFYEKHDNYTTMIQPHFRDSKQDNVRAASAAIDLLKNVQVMAILGPQTSSQADFVIDIGSKSKVPIISPATSPSLSPKDDVYFIRSAHNSSSQLKAIAALIKNFGWREVVFVYEDGEYGRGLDPYLSDAMLDINVRIMYRSIIHPLVSDDWILQELYKLKTMQTRVFVIHALPALASRFFKKVNEAGMMEEGYIWIITEVLMSQMHSLDSTDIDSMQGVLGVKSYIPRSKELINFEKIWKREFQRRNPQDEVTELDMFGIWGYDTVYGLAMALEKVGNGINLTFKKGGGFATDLDVIGTSDLGSRLLPWIRDFRFDGMSGDFNVVDGQLQSSVYQIVNILGTGEKHIGFWTSEIGLSKKADNQTKGLRAITWPGDTHVLPKGWEMPTSNVNKLRVGVPAKGGFVQFVDANTDPKTRQVIVTGFCVDVFNAVIDALPYAIKREFIPFVTPDGKRLAGSYNDLVRNLSVGKYDAVAGDVTILAKRTDYADFTLPYTEAGISLIVPIKDERKSPWIFLRPLENELWITTGWFFLYTGLVIWVLEHHINKEFRGPPGEQIGTIFWFSFSTLVFAHREKLANNLSRFVVIVWVFVVLVLTSSYTASLTSMLTVQQLQPAYTDIYEIMRRGESVGYQDGSFVVDTLKKMGFEESKLKNYSTFEQYDNALHLGSQNGGVTAIMDEIPYIRVFLAKYCTKYTMTGPIYKTAGFGFAFPKGSPLVHDVSRAVLQVTEDQIANISRHWFGDSSSCDQQKKATLTSDRLSLDSFKGLFFITAVSSTAALLIFFFMFLYQNREIIASQHSIIQKIVATAKTFNKFKDDKSKNTSAEAAVAQPVSVDSFNNSPTIVHHQEVGSFTPGEGPFTTEPGTPVHDTIQTFSTTELGTPEPDIGGIQVVETTT
uniref:glutamate receptor 2.8-like n=1 Tax=Erigeron canadensis TaxID=72917 RepID=UPI001CB9CE1E|nr:glutamate receptor 2.8-like [Erigeron canadensis]